MLPAITPNPNHSKVHRAQVAQASVCEKTWVSKEQNQDMNQTIEPIGGYYAQSLSGDTSSWRGRSGRPTRKIHSNTASLTSRFDRPGSQIQRNNGIALLPGCNYGTARAINSMGQVLGTSTVSEPGTWNAGPARTVLWRDGGVYDLQTVLERVSGAGCTILQASALNYRGQIVGLGVHNGKNRAFLLTPISK